MLDFICNGSVDLFGTGEGANNSKWKYMAPAGFEPTPSQCTKGKSAPSTARPRGPDGDNWIKILKNCYVTTHVNLIMVTYVFELIVRPNFHFLSGVGSNPAGSIYFNFEFFAPSPFRTGQRSPCKWIQAWPFTCSHSCFRLQIRLII